MLAIFYFLFYVFFCEKKTGVEYVSRENQYTKSWAVLASVFIERVGEEN